MKKHLTVLIIAILLTNISCQKQIKDESMSLEENKRNSTLYHERNLEDIDKVLADNFIGRYYGSEGEIITWDEEGHRNAIINYPDWKDSIIVQVAEGDMVATRFLRKGTWDENFVRVEIMQFMRFQDGKILESFEIMAPMMTTNETEESKSETDMEEIE